MIWGFFIIQKYYFLPDKFSNSLGSIELDAIDSGVTVFFGVQTYRIRDLAAKGWILISLSSSQIGVQQEFWRYTFSCGWYLAIDDRSTVYILKRALFL